MTVETDYPKASLQIDSNVDSDQHVGLLLALSVVRYSQTGGKMSGCPNDIYFELKLSSIIHILERIITYFM